MRPRTRVFHMARKSFALDSFNENENEVEPLCHSTLSSVAKAFANAFVFDSLLDFTSRVRRQFVVTVITAQVQLHSSSEISPAAIARS